MFWKWKCKTQKKHFYPKFKEKDMIVQNYCSQISQKIVLKTKIPWRIKMIRNQTSPNFESETEPALESLDHWHIGNTDNEGLRSIKGNSFWKRVFAKVLSKLSIPCINTFNKSGKHSTFSICRCCRKKNLLNIKKKTY